jgi:hypothetical protein
MATPSLFEQAIPEVSYPQKAGACLIDDIEDLPELCRDSVPLYRVHRLIFVAICNANNWEQLDCF